ncbi:MAG: anhydro-N-acetylmuramic acid kinase [Burkholderiales bacterium]
MQTREHYIGLMSGTSLDGVDAVLAEFSGEAPPRPLHSAYQAFPPGLRQTLLALNQAGGNELERASLAGNQLAGIYAETVAEVLRQASLPAAQIRAIGCHGQTVRHRPDAGFTIQIGNPALLAELTGIGVVADFRSRDIAAGGQGAPLVPAFHDALFRDAEKFRVIVNIGGIGNLTCLPPQGEAYGFDCGPGNILMDGWCERHTGQAYDRDGAWAESGKPIPALLAALQAHAFFRQPPPKSTGRDDFNLAWLAPHLSEHYAPEAVQATLLHLTASSITDAIHRHAAQAEEVYLCGGGAHNLALRRLLAQQLAPCHVSDTDELGVPANWVEAFAFAWLARQTLHGQPGNLPAVTGARHPCILGAIYPA